MKKVISMLVATVLVGTVAFAQNSGETRKREGEDWRERVRAAQVAFLTSELDLTEAEAQSFWPVYNDVQKQRREAFGAMQKAYMELTKGIDSDNIAKLLANYLDARKANDAIELEAVERYKKVIPVQKVAKLLLAEEKFRHQQIGRLGQGGGPFGGQNGRQGTPPPMGRGGNRGGHNAPTQPEA